MFHLKYFFYPSESHPSEENRILKFNIYLKIKVVKIWFTKNTYLYNVINNNSEDSYESKKFLVISLPESAGLLVASSCSSNCNSNK